MKPLTEVPLESTEHLQRCGYYGTYPEVETTQRGVDYPNEANEDIRNLAERRGLLADVRAGMLHLTIAK